MHILWTLIVGFLVGLVAKLLMPGRAPSGFIITIILGIAGAFLAEWIGQQLNFYAEGQPAGFIASVIGAMILLFFYGLFTRNRPPPV
ncbi:GlsB/YeaQ/YmgE family stress response membrane protein [Acetobacteraceae bacterium EV16G]|uniref:GlsB/YeaQ/YmgE family stress response membrane protein n=2 Tax=Acetobacteraceae TaxID=433 RepID=A0ABY6GJU7_9PROT|nr:GlsB/YeaQ/YmgE family stress response membrane protein [Candidatus Kirkpatrickella diaphorinae]UYH51720.1 GlsB/YeaQ/YmgE family stress response membrane protein [Candidatus Kirkpatrickella diaphorinae]